MTSRAVRVVPLLLLVAACAGAPERRTVDPRVGLPERWTGTEAADAGPVDGTWWNQLGDPRLPELIAAAIERNHDLRAAAARVDQAAAAARIAGADLRPTVGAGLSATRQKQNFIGFPEFGPSGAATADGPLAVTSTRFGVSIDTAWEIDLWGRLRAATRAALAELQASEASLRAARLSIAGQTAKAWFTLLEARQQLRLAADTAESRRGSAERVRSRYARGLRPALDLRLALSTLADAESLVEQRSRQLDAVARQLELLLGRYPSRSLLDRFPPGDLPTELPPVPVGLPAELVARRPDLAVAERRLAAADQRWRAARRALYPRLTLAASGGTATRELEDLLDGDFGVWSLVGGLVQPIFQGGRLRAGVAQADAVADERLEAYLGLALVAFGEVETALAAEAYLARQEQFLAESTRQLRAAERLADRRYRSGVGPYLEVLEAQSRTLAADSARLTTRRERLANRVDLHLALGGGFEPPDDVADPTGSDGGAL